MQRTLAILKPDCVRKNLIGKVIKRFEAEGFKIVAMKLVKLNSKTAGEFYAVHKERPFFYDLVSFMTSGPCVPIVLEKENAIEDYRKVIGATDPAEADKGTVRKMYADSKEQNICHGSDAPETAAFEIGYFFSGKELVENME
ncbi:nucleoside-diphosphate kinase [candidate division KSB1 bacterium]|nr:nucleoside-diphosphate kinase [candidate division KSB1 bacterium]MBL7094013.1 nucleoside-diphosphate kinase [candidate division KSB1 bacterium]